MYNKENESSKNYTQGKEIKLGNIQIEPQKKSKTKNKLKEVTIHFKYSDNKQTRTTSPITKFPKNIIVNQKYSIITFLPIFLYEQFKFFLNLYFLIIAIFQFIPEFQIVYWWSSWLPLIFVLTISAIKEIYDDVSCYKRDKTINNQLYEILTENGIEKIPSSKIQVGDILILHTHQRVPADSILLRTNTDHSGSIFIKTDQMDGETDWKLRKSIPSLQDLNSDKDLLELTADMKVEAPNPKIYEFNGSLHHKSKKNNEIESLNLENTLWANTVIASGSAICCVIYTGKHTRSIMSNVGPKFKSGILDYEINKLSKIIFVAMFTISAILCICQGLSNNSFIVFGRYILLLSYILPISLRVNLDMGKTLYSYLIMEDEKIKNTIIRNSNIAEELGRISYLFTDKTGTLTKNIMTFKKLICDPDLHYDNNRMESITKHINDSMKDKLNLNIEKTTFKSEKIYEFILAMALCHNVTPVIEENGLKAYQASSPDEIALVKFAEKVGISLYFRNSETICLSFPLFDNKKETYEIINIFPFTSEKKRMGIILKSVKTGKIIFYLKGAEDIMQNKISSTYWLLEEVDNLAREGLRTLVFAYKYLTNKEYEEFLNKYNEANLLIQNRQEKVDEVINSLEKDMEILGISGVEDKLQKDVKSNLEVLKQAGITVWMLTGDKAETAICIGRSTRIIGLDQEVITILGMEDNKLTDVLKEIKSADKYILVIDGVSLQKCLDMFKTSFLEFALKMESVIVCRCSPTQKSEVVKLIKKETNKRVCAVGDGGNDVNMIQEANIGIGIVGVEGKQASLAADVSLDQFSFLSRLILWHGRNSYIRSARLAQFVFHRGIIISVIQVIFSAIFFFLTVPIFNGWLMVGYSTLFTMAPVFSLVSDLDVTEKNIMMFPQLYEILQDGEYLSYKIFVIWCLKSIYQGGAIMWFSMLIFHDEILNIISIVFTSLILSELINIAFEINTWNKWIVISEFVSVSVYISSLFILKDSFDTNFVMSVEFLWKTFIITIISCLPIYIGKQIHRKIHPPAHLKVKTDD